MFQSNIVFSISYAGVNVIKYLSFMIYKIFTAGLYGRVHLKKYIAAKYLETQKGKYICNDPAFEKELEYNINELTDAIEKELISWRNFDTEDCLVAANGEI